ncbi:MAG TPA: sigma-70 family RNA polymerase sigma factor [Verrucomicrobiae bacterium]|nr:sigma-70 family RNA polymerase sigma factor [Verrucomicrobiae bacterium]
MSDVTRILNAIGGGDSKAAQDLLPLVYEELRKLAAHKMANEAPGQTLQPTALVHEAWLRLVGTENPQFEGRGHFFAAAAEAMRRILIDRARQKLSLKRGAGAARVNLEDLEVASAADDDTLLAVDEALTKLAREDPDSAEFIKLRFFAGMTNDEAAQALGIPERTARRHWSFARAWLFREIQRQSGA